MKNDIVTKDKRIALVRPLTLITALLALIAALVGLFPSQKRLTALSSQGESDALSIAYLQLLLRVHPDDDALRRALAHNLAAAGKWADARSVLAPLLGQPHEGGRRARMEALEIDFLVAKSLKTGSPERTGLRNDIARQLENLRTETSDHGSLARLADISLAMALPHVAAPIYQKLAAVDKAGGQRWLDLAATQYLASGAPDQAARAYQEAAQIAQDDVQGQRKYTLLAIDAYLAASQGAQALALAEASAPHFAGDLAFMRRMVAMALAQNDTVLAQRSGRALVALAPDDADILSQQVEVEIAAKDLLAALALATRLVALEPANNEKRTRMAHLAEWAGKQDIALEQWIWLAREPSGSEARSNAMRLALGKEDDGLWLALAGQVFQARPMNPEESAALVAIQSRGRAPKQLVAFLQNYAKRYPLQRAQWEALANAQEQQGDLPAAIASWRGMSPQLISPPESARRQAELLLRAQRPDEAWAALQEARTGAAPGEAAYWQAYGDTAWARESRPEALLAYRTAWEGGSSNALAIERLIALYNASAEPEQAIAVGKQAYERLAEARWLLLAMDAASQASRWEASRDLSSLAQHDEAKFAGSEMYWLLEAHIASHDGRKARARKAYRQALALNPAAVPTRVQLLWFEHDYGDAQQLGEHVAKWRSDAQADPAYWSVYAVALLKLNRVDESLVWFEKQAAAKPDDYVWQVGYFDALADAGGGDAAQRLRASMMPRLRARLGTAGKTAKPPEKTLWLAYASMVRHFDGEPAGDQVLQDMLARGHKDADVYALLVGSSLAQEKFDKARYWLVRAEADQHKLPAYQSLAVALAQDDLQAIDRILQLQEKELTPADRVTALRRLGRNVLALSLTEQSLLEADDASSERLRQHREQLRAQLARRIEAGYEARNLSDLKIKRSEVAVSFPLDAGRATLRLAHNALDPEAGGVLRHSRSLNEDDISVLAEVAVGANPLRLTLGRNQRDEHSLTYGRLELTHALTKRWNARLDVSINGLTEETSALRAIGSKDKVGVGLNGSLSESVYARAELAGQRFNTRQGEKLGQGARLEGEIGTRLSKGSPAWQLRLSGSTERNRLVDSLPASLQPLAASPSQAVDGILSSRFSTLGVGATLRSGQGEGMERRPQGVVDGWVGRQWPANELAYSLRAGMRLPVASAGQVRFEAFYTNVQGGVSSQANRGVGVWYRHEF